MFSLARENNILIKKKKKGVYDDQNCKSLNKQAENKHKLKHTSVTNNKTLRPGKVQKYRA